MAFSPNGGLLAETNHSNSTVSLFTKASSGWAAGSAIPTVGGYSGAGAANSVAFSPSGGLLATADSAYGVSLFAVNGSGLTPVTGSPFPAGGIAGSVAFSPDGSLLASANTTSNSVSLFTVGGSGLAPVSGSPFPTGAIGAVSVAFSPDGGLLAVANQGSNSVSLFTVSSSGMTAVPGGPVSTGAATQPSSVAFSPDGHLLAVADYGYVSGPNGVSLFSVSAAGLTPVASSPFSTGANSGPVSLAFGPGGGVLATADSTSNSIHLFTVTGAGLTAAPGSPYPTGASPRSIALSPVGGLLATANYFDDTVSLFSFPAPSASITTPANGATFTQHQAVTASYSCQDAPGGPGIASCAGTVANGSAIDTSTVGLHTFTVSAVSRSGLSGGATTTYTVTGRTHPTTPTQAGTSKTSGKVSSSGYQAFSILNSAQSYETAGLLESFNCPIPLWGSCGQSYTPAAAADAPASRGKVRFHIIAIASGHTRIRPHGRVTIKLKLSRTARRLLRGQHHLRVMLSGGDFAHSGKLLHAYGLTSCATKTG